MDISRIARAYDAISAIYLRNREMLKSGRHVRQLLKYLPKQSTILDLGCGAGVPVDDLLLKAGHHVIGIDISREQIKLARKHCPAGEYLVRDIADLHQGEYQVEGVVAMYSMFHLSRSKQGAVVKTIASFLSASGMFLVTMGDRAFEGEHTLYGAKLWSSQYGTEKNREIITEAGFDIVSESIDTSGGERHQVLLCKKR